ncbi:unnamed protein product [Clonostachys solani]|uniref:Nephrocystin 3-like N-terminal domain-containing protein n=1 Tax=Clonostachys solani TaxID=160281 RepID=A0A9N9ZDF3_9HYPO|nr:unnamed protein product [Clonostachys solani]
MDQPQVHIDSNPDTANETKRSDRGKTFRIRAVPITWDSNRLASFLRDSTDDTHPTVLSLAPEIHGRTQTATATFLRVPPLPRGAKSWRIPLPAGNQLQNKRQKSIELDGDFLGVTTLYHPPPHEHQTDIVAISGIGGHAFGSFKERGGDYMWLRDGLADDLTTARIMIYGYKSTIPNSKSMQNLADLALSFYSSLESLIGDEEPKPIVFIAHSLGGLIVKKALSELAKSENEVHVRLIQAVHGLVFFGVPNDGMDIKSLIPMAGDGPNRSLIESLSSSNSDVLRTLHQEFHDILGSGRMILCFYETELSPTAQMDENGKWSMRGPETVLVTQASAINCRRWETGSAYICPISRNHSDMVKFEEEDEEYEKVRGRIRNIVRKAKIHPPVYNVRSRAIYDDAYSSNPPLVMRTNQFTDTQDTPTQIHSGVNEFDGRHTSQDLSYTQKQEDETHQAEKDACLRSLGFSRIDDRYHAIDAAHPGTCEWLFETPSFQRWWHRDEIELNNGVLWIKGKPGAGKSTLMKHILHWCENPDHLKPKLIIRYFFNARGVSEEKSVLGMLRSMVNQLLTEDSTIFDNFFQIFRQRDANKQDWVWEVAPLTNFILELAKNKAARPMVILIDALDECDESDVRLVVDFLENLSCHATYSGFELRICLSSRHYPNITMNKMVQLIVETDQGHENDISTYIKAKLRVQDDGVQEKVQKKADGIFMWTVLVVSILNKEFDQGSREILEKTLEDVPGDLEEVFANLLLEDGKADPETALMFQWVLFSQKLLKPQELFLATQMGLSPDSDGVWDNSKYTLDYIKRRIVSISKGLIEVRSGSNKDDDPYVQFIHLSVKDFLSRNNRLQALDPTIGHEPVRLSHRRLWRICWDCINRFHAQNADFSNEDPYFEAKLSSPFIKYAASYLFDHANWGISDQQKSSGGWFQNPFKSRNQDASKEDLEKWLNEHKSWYELWQRSPRYQSGLKFQLDVSEGIVYVFSAGGYAQLLRPLLKRKSIDVRAQSAYHGTPLHAASYFGHIDIAQILLGAGVNVNTQGGRYGSALQAASTGGNKDIVQLLLDAGADVKARGGRYGGALQAASFNGKRDIVQLLLHAGADLNAVGDEYGTALYSAAYSGHIDAALLLLDEGADVNTQGGKFGNALQAASRKGAQDIVELLLNVGADVNAQGGKYHTALQAASIDETEIVKVLLDAGADANAQGGHYGNALQAACYHGATEIVPLLLAAGADANAKGEFGTPLQAAAQYIRVVGAREMVKQLLLDAGAVQDAASSRGKVGGRKKVKPLVLIK